MKSPRAHWWRIFCLMLNVVALIACCSCRTPADSDFPRIINEPAPLAESVRRQFGVVGVLPVAMATNIHFYAPKDGVGAFTTIADKTWNKMARPVDWRVPRSDEEATANVAGLSFIALASLTAGIVGGTVAGVSEEQFQKSQENLRAALREEPLDAGIQKRLASASAAASLTNVRLLPESALADLKLHGDTKDFSAFAARGIDSILDVRVSQVGFELKSGLNPELAFIPEVVIYVIRVSDGSVVHASYLDYRGSKRPFTGWADNQAQAFRSEMRRAEQEFVRAILEKYFSTDSLSQR